MPHHRIPRASLHEDLLALEREGETVVSVVADGDVFDVITAYKGAETRLDEYRHSARLGVMQPDEIRTIEGGAA